MVRRSTVWKAKKQEEKRLQKALIGLSLGAIMVFSIFGIVASFATPSGIAQNNENIEDLGVRFRAALLDGQPVYVTNIQREDVIFYILPSQLGFFQAPQQAKELLRSPNLQVTFIPEQNQTGVFDAVRLALANDAFVQNTNVAQGVLSHNNTLYAGLPLISCEDATADNPVVLLDIGQTTSITAQDNCVVAQASSPSEMFWLGEFLRYVRYNII